MSKRLRDDYGLVHDAVRRHGDALRFASESLANTEPIVKAAVANCGRSLEHASGRLCSDAAVVALAVGQNADALAYANAALQVDPAVILEAARTDVRRALLHVPAGGDGDKGSYAALLNQVYWQPGNQTFLRTFLFGMLPQTRQSRGGYDCALARLNLLGKQFAVQVKKEIAAYAGFVTLPALEKAAKEAAEKRQKPHGAAKSLHPFHFPRA